MVPGLNEDIITEIPVIDLNDMNSDLEGTASKVLSAAKDVGFFFIRIPPEQKEHLAMFEKSQEFFSMPMDHKLKYLLKVEENVGYSAMRQEKVDPKHSTKGDFKESFNIGRLINEDPIQDLPPLFANNLDLIRKFQNICNTTVCNIMECLAIALKIPEDQGGRTYFSKRYLDDEAPGDILRVLHYPPRTGNDDDQKEEIRIGRHSDYGLLTLLWQRQVGGLQIQGNQEMDDPKKMTWIDVPVKDDCIIVNLADCLQYWTNGLIRSTTHRVVFHPDTLHKSRYSMAYFVQGGAIPLDPVPSDQIPCTPPTSPPFSTSGDYVKYRLALTYGHSY
ncbi:uncharacterized protein BX664DRAFT_324046 [Halteromyces radiatus]|uniref:uncharacterized protein n=1 Tax=Halteromyces radiatus TaxID=101107 RepID=UPI0022203491|nr:uncharacterized protein BX664DRAFT_324046 [Halteromyces radiatus]KAI8096459.1 hypothetical protein BX664DRAFT_324046 [Halteromyces radiatus]